MGYNICLVPCYEVIAINTLYISVRVMILPVCFLNYLSSVILSEYLQIERQVVLQIPFPLVLFL